MSLNILEFIILFFALLMVMLVLQFVTKGNKLGKSMQLLSIIGFSAFFMYKFDLRFLAVLLLTTLFTFWMGKKIAGAVDQKRKQFCGLGCFILCLVLGYFKYVNFFLASVMSLLGKDFILLKIILPIGISFYVFSAISYLVDVFRKDMAAEDNLLLFILYMLFFPKVSAGPIVRAKDFLPQVHAYHGLCFNKFSTGIQLFVLGLFMKIVLADRLKVFVDDVFHAPVAYDTATVLLCIVSNSLQIYFDFAGYSNMAIGISNMLGFEIKENFNLPYLAKNMSDFWKRWHISLSSWLKDYIYIPLGGSRVSPFRTYINVMIVMLVSGLWHGANWTFVLWGGFHGILTCINVIWKKSLKKYLGSIANAAPYDVFSIVITYIAVALLWVIFRAETFAKAEQIFKGAFTVHSGIHQMYTWTFFAIVCLLVSSVLAWYKSKVETIKAFVPKLDLTSFLGQVVFFTFVGITIMMGYYGNTAFIYGKF